MYIHSITEMKLLLVIPVIKIMGQLLCKPRSLRLILKYIHFNIVPLWRKEALKHICSNISFHKFIETSQNFDILEKLNFKLTFLCYPFCMLCSCDEERAGRLSLNHLCIFLILKLLSTDLIPEKLWENLLSWLQSFCREQSNVPAMLRFLSAHLLCQRQGRAIHRAGALEAGLCEKRFCSWLRITFVVQCSPKNPEYS